MATMLIALAVLFQGMGESAHAWLRYDREAVLAGQLWRLLTAHLIHLSWAHLALNAVALAFMAALLGKQQRAPDWWLATFTSALAVGIGLLWLRPSLAWYVGLSGVAHGLFAAGCLALLRRQPATAVLTLAALIFKLIWEQNHPMDAAREAFLGGAVIVDAHLFGATGGLLAGLAIHARPLLCSFRRQACRGRHMV